MGMRGEGEGKGGGKEGAVGVSMTRELQEIRDRYSLSAGVREGEEVSIKFDEEC